jgi:hypothetical protein
MGGYMNVLIEASMINHTPLNATMAFMNVSKYLTAICRDPADSLQEPAWRL